MKGGSGSGCGGQELQELRFGSPTRSTIPSATPSAQAASTLPPTYLILVLSFLLRKSSSSSSLRAFNGTPSTWAKYRAVRPVKLVTMFLPMRSLGDASGPCSGTCTCSLHLPNPRSKMSSTPDDALARAVASCSATWSLPVMPKSTRPSPTNVGMSAAGRKTRAISKFLTKAISSLCSRRNWISEPSSRSSAACWRRPSTGQISRELTSGVAYLLFGIASRRRPSKLWGNQSCCHVGQERHQLIDEIHNRASKAKITCTEGNTVKDMK